jgi:Pyruvate/2-oxoacid:ferredoxin oxidoreductase delta subunit/coenzyme F420-reducing hydrogenase delta subunit
VTLSDIKRGLIMNIAVLGTGRVNNLLEKELCKEGIIPQNFENIDEIKDIHRAADSFAILAKSGEYKASHIIVAEEPDSDGDFYDSGFNSHGCKYLYDTDLYNSLSNSKSTIVFILDYPMESPTYYTRDALRYAVEFAEKKRRVIYLSRFMRTAGVELEEMYNKARNLGVVFLKYDNINIHYSDDDGFYKITATDMYGSMEINTDTPVLAGKREKSGNLLKIMGQLRLKVLGVNQVNNEKYFLFPSHTGRRGIYFINLKTASGSIDELKSQVQYLITDIKGNSETVSEYAVVDPGKCAYCYTCYRACPHSAMTPDHEQSAMKNIKEDCFGCGICASICPASAVKMVRETLGEKSSQPRGLKVFCCRNSAKFAMDKVISDVEKSGYSVTASVACGGDLGPETLISTLKDFDKVLVAVCMDNACRHMEGNKRALRNVQRAKEILKASGLDENRINYLQVSHAMSEVLNEVIG